ncbi:fluoride efflux transporter CrcB [Sphingomonas montanisoli]|uniref:Fluoride-specific ion channel FluC n=1 Tax=Sphingomonas montanisoli TaxID=2606412 RepID=A0A5D9C8G1_9SPHN|nr:fluoride efflux transporter CrcB [Sphingomonas montanisoli]TZG26315.1 fluoride efflux transporter CrcB [Sphingomonas montanisoli]
MPPLLLVMIGGAIGSGFRYHLSYLMIRLFGPGFPWGTWAANLIGGFLMGILVGLLLKMTDGGEPVRLFFGVGVLGGFTTFSSFTLETINMFGRGDYALGAAYVGSSVAGSLLALMAGLALVRIA